MTGSQTTPEVKPRGESVLDRIHAEGLEADRRLRQRRRAEYWQELGGKTLLIIGGIGLVVLTWAAGALADAWVTQNAHWSPVIAFWVLTEDERHTSTQRIQFSAILRTGVMFAVAVWVVSALAFWEIKRAWKAGKRTDDAPFTFGMIVVLASSMLVTFAIGLQMLVGF
jgi:hypothetical protein